MKTLKKKDIFQATSNGRTNKRRQCNVIFFNPPFSCSAKLKIGKKFLNCVKKYLSATPTFHQIFNTNKIKISYGCIGNIK